MRNMSSPEESVAPTILSGSRRRSNPLGLSSPGMKTFQFHLLSSVKSQQTIIHLFSWAFWWWTCPVHLPCACCPLAYLRGPKSYIFIINWMARIPEISFTASAKITVLFVFSPLTFSFRTLSNSSIRSAQSKLSLGSQVLSWRKVQA